MEGKSLVQLKVQRRKGKAGKLNVDTKISNNCLSLFVIQFSYLVSSFYLDVELKGFEADCLTWSCINSLY